jgi:AcrR family transcriptional regulator
MPRPKAKESVRQARNDAYRRILFAAAERVFAKHGFDATRMQDIADEGGVSVGTLYEIYPGKSELFRAIQEERGRDLLGQAARVVAADATAKDTLLEGIGVYLGFFMGHPDYLRIHLREGTAWAVLPSPSSEVQLRAWQEGQTLLSHLFARGIEEGVFLDEDPALLARTMTAMHQVLLADWMEKGMKAPPSQIIARARQFFLRTFVTTGRGRRSRAS